MCLVTVGESRLLTSPGTPFRLPAAEERVRSHLRGALDRGAKQEIAPGGSPLWRKLNGRLC